MKSFIGTTGIQMIDARSKPTGPAYHSELLLVELP